MSPLPTGPLSPQEEADWRDIARAHRDGTSMTSRFFATLDAARHETEVALARLSKAEDRIRELEPEPGAWIGDW